MERQFFQGSTSPQQYQQMIHKRCQELHSQPQSNPSMQQPPYMQNQPQPPNGMPNGRNFPAPNGQQPFPSGAQLPPNDFLQPAAPQAPMQQPNQQQRAPNMGLNNGSNEVKLTNEELRVTIAQAQKQFEEASRNGSIHQLRQQIAGMGSEQQRMLGQQGDPALMFLTVRCRRNLQQMKHQMATQNGMPPAQADQTGRTVRTPMTGQNQFGAGGAPFDPSQFAGLQAEALRSQASGDDVVPASNHQFQNGQPPMFKNMRNQQGQNFPQPNQLPPRQNMTQMPQQSRQMTDQATAQAHAQARMNQRNQPPNRTPQQDGLQGQVGGLHSDNAGRFASPMATLNQPLSNQHTSTPRQLQNRPQGPSPMQSNQQPAQPGPHQHQPPPGHSDVPGWVRMIHPVLQNLYHSMPEHMKINANSMHPNKACKILQSMHQQQLNSGNYVGDRAQTQQNLPQPQDQAMQRPAGAGMGQPPNIDPSRQQQRPMPQQPQTGGMMPPNVQQIMNQFPGGRDGIDAMPLPRDEIARSIPNISIPDHLGTWGAFMQWARESLRPDVQQRVIGFQQRWLINEGRNRSAKQQPPPTAQMSSAQDLTKDPQFLQTPHVPYNTINEREAVRTGMVVLVNGMPRPAPPTQEQLAHFRKMPQFSGRSDHVLSQMYIQSNLQKLRSRDEPLWKEIIRIQATMAKQQQRQHAGNQVSHSGPDFQAQQQPQQLFGPGGPTYSGMPGRQQQQQQQPPPPHPQSQIQFGQGFQPPNARPSSRQSGRVQYDKTVPPDAHQQANIDNRRQQLAGRQGPQPPQIQPQAVGQPQDATAPNQSQTNQISNRANLPQIPPQQAEEYDHWKNEVVLRAKAGLGDFQKRPKQMIQQVVEIMGKARGSQIFPALLAVAPYFYLRFRGQPTYTDLLARHMTTVSNRPVAGL